MDINKDYKIVAWGGGVNSTAMLCGLKDKGIVPDLILFADTGGEKKETYQYIDIVQKWLSEHSFPKIITVSGAVKYKSLEEQCLSLGVLPSVAYGWKTCSQRWKIEPQDKYIRKLPEIKEKWQNGEKVIKIIGYDADESKRAKNYTDDRFDFWYPLIEWNWSRENCIKIILDNLLPLPPKSSCFFCPHNRKSEVIWLYKNHRDLFDRAIIMEKGSENKNITVKGLGRKWSWDDLINKYKNGDINENGDVINKKNIKLNVMPDPDDVPCGCFDGSYEDTEECTINIK